METNPYLPPASGGTTADIREVEYRPATTLARLLVGALALDGALLVVMSVAGAVLAWAHSASAPPPGVDSLLYSTLRGAGLAYSPVSLSGMVLFLIWIYRANGNARALGAKAMEFTEGWCVAWFFVPLANLVRPYQAVREIHQASAPIYLDGPGESAILSRVLKPISAPESRTPLTWGFEPLDPALDRTAIDPGTRSYNEEELLRFYRAMRLARTFETKLAAIYRQGKILGAVYLGIGQEAIATGVVSLLRPEDVFSTVSRDLAGWFYRGVEPKHVLARWLGKDIPPGHGRDLGLFLADLENYGIAPYHNGSMASWIPSGAGFALAFKLRREPRVYVAFTGDGATSPGDFYEGLNFAAIHKLPLVVIAENNGFAYSTPIERQMPVRNIADRAPAFNVYSEMAFGNDIFTVVDVASRAIEHARSGRGPALVEFKTFRRRGHGEHDDMAYVPREMQEYWQARDPIRLFTDYLIERAGFDREVLARLDDRCAAVVEAAVEYAEALPLPRPESVTERLFAP